jgi:hypothetical protein
MAERCIGPVIDELYEQVSVTPASVDMPGLITIESLLKLSNFDPACSVSRSLDYPGRKG